MERFTEDDLAQMVLRLAHGIRNPLATIKSDIQLVQHMTHPEGKPAEYLDSALAEISRIDTIVKDMERFVRMDNQTFTVVRIGDVVASAAERCRALAQERRASVSILPGPIASVFVDEEQLIQAIEELMVNGILFSEQRPMIHVTWHRHESGSVVIDVDDSCGGILASHQEKMKRPFYSSSTQGTGLGLNIVARICRLCGGTLDWKNREPRGCRFTMTLPEFTQHRNP